PACDRQRPRQPRHWRCLDADRERIPRTVCVEALRLSFLQKSVGDVRYRSVFYVFCLAPVHIKLFRTERETKRLLDKHHSRSFGNCYKLDYRIHFVRPCFLTHDLAGGNFWLMAFLCPASVSRSLLGAPHGVEFFCFCTRRKFVLQASESSSMVQWQHRISSYPSFEPARPELLSEQVSKRNSSFLAGAASNTAVKLPLSHIAPLGRR